MKYTSLNIQTQREFPNNARTRGWGWLVRAGYLTRENELTALGSQMVKRLEALSEDPSFVAKTGLNILKMETGTAFPLSTGELEVAHCSSCDYAALLATAKFKKTPMPQEEEHPLEKVATPDCHTIEALADFLNIPKL